ncbi:MAG: glycosyltransferase [Pseudobdellovibrio sp.]
MQDVNTIPSDEHQRQSHGPLTVMMGFSSLLNLALPLILVRMLSADQVGLYKLFFLYAATAPWLLFSSGFGNGLYYWAGKKSLLKYSLSATWTLQLMWSLGIILIGLMIYPVLHALIPNFQLSEFYLYVCLVLSVAVSISSPFYEETLIATGMATRAGWYSAFWELIKTLSMIAAAFVFKSVNSVIYVFSLVMMLKFFVSVLLTLKKNISSFAIKNNPQLTPVLKYALPASGAAALAVILSYCDQFILSYYLPAADFAVYALGCLSIPPLLIFEQSVNKVMIPELSESLYTIKDSTNRRSQHILRTAIADLSLWIIPSVVGLFLFAGPITRLLFTDKYPATENFLRLYCCIYLFYIIPYDAWARAMGNSKWILKTIATFAIISLIGTLAGVHIAGAYGALTCFLLCQLSIRLYSLFYMHKHLGWKITNIIPFNFIAKISLWSITIGVFSYASAKVFSSESIGLFIMGTLFWIIYVLLALPSIFRNERRKAKNKKVLILTQYLNVGGLERMILNLSQELVKQGQWFPTVYVYDQIPNTETIDHLFKNIRVVRCNKAQGFSIRTGYRISQYCRHNHIDQIHAHDLGALIYAVMAKFFSLGRLRVIYTQHSFVHLKKGPKYTVYEKIFPKFCDTLTVVSEQLKDQYVTLGTASQKIHVIKNGIPLPETFNGNILELKNELSAQIKKLSPQLQNFDLSTYFWITQVARLHSGKGQMEALEIWNQLPNEIQEKTLLIFVGGETDLGFKKQLTNKTSLCPLKENIIFVGNSYTPEKWLQATDLFISASHEEGMPLSPLEALSYNKELFLSDIAGHKIFKNIAHYFDLKDLNAASQNLIELIKNLKNHDVLNPHRKYEEIQKLLYKYSAQQMTRQYTHLYEIEFTQETSNGKA